MTGTGSTSAIDTAQHTHLSDRSKIKADLWKFFDFFVNILSRCLFSISPQVLNNRFTTGVDMMLFINDTKVFERRLRLEYNSPIIFIHHCVNDPFHFWQQLLVMVYTVEELKKNMA
jgi:hypothetical protein